ncbi:MAG: type II secretion system protein [Phycisphaerales bacterium]
MITPFQSETTASHLARRPGGAELAAGTPDARRGFTLVELLVAISIVLVLAGLTAVAVNAARGKAKEAKALSTLTALSNATSTFQTDHGYIPPLLTLGRDEYRYPNLSARANNPEAWRGRVYFADSVTSPAEYLLGYGDWTEDGYGATDADGSYAGDDQEIPATGIRSPGVDGYWSVVDADMNGRRTLDERRSQLLGDSSFRRRPEFGNNGKVYGPYIAPQDLSLVGVTDGTFDAVTGKVTVLFAGDPGYDPTFPRVLCDPWGNAIQYFRRPSPPSVPNTFITRGDFNGNGTADPAPSLSDFVRLRPWDLEPGTAVDSEIADANGDTTTSTRLQSANYAYFSGGADGLWAGSDNDVRVDDAELNRDNLVEVGK